MEWQEGETTMWTPMRNACARPWILACALVSLLMGATGARANEAAAVEEILAILHDKGLIDESQHEDLLAKHYREQTKAAAPATSFVEGWKLKGDLRLRHEATSYDRDATGLERDNRYRFRYRARLGLEKAINDWATFGLTLASGTDDLRSTNQSFGDAEDFDPDEIYIDRAWVRFDAPSGPGGMRTHLTAGKVGNPFLWKSGKDLIVWDSDINPEGAYIGSSWKATSAVDLWGAVGGFIVDENSTASDPKLVAAQIGTTARLTDTITFGGRLSGYEWRSLDTRFVGEAASWGNLPSAFDHGRARIGEIGLHATFAHDATWPVTIYGTFVRNFSAESAVIGGTRVGEEDTAWSLGVETGSSSQLFRVGAGYFHVEANSVIGQFTDSDLFDGYTNRKGFLLYGARVLGPNVELKLTFAQSDEIEDDGLGAGPFSDSIRNANRRRLQTDLEMKF